MLKSQKLAFHKCFLIQHEEITFVKEINLQPYAVTSACQFSLTVERYFIFALHANSAEGIVRLQYLFTVMKHTCESLAAFMNIKNIYT
jgi:hypothetical protein